MVKYYVSFLDRREIMSRVADNPIELPAGVEFSVAGRTITIKGNNGVLDHELHPSIRVIQENGHLKILPDVESMDSNALAGTARALLQNMITGVSVGHQRKLTITGVGYRAQMQDKVLNLNLGFAHTIRFPIPEGIAIETPEQTEIIIKGADKQQVGQIAADIRCFRPPDPYKGKGVRYVGETVVRKETKKS